MLYIAAAILAYHEADTALVPDDEPVSLFGKDSF